MTNTIKTTKPIAAGTEARATPRMAGLILASGAIIMLIGTALWASSGADLDRALDSGDMAGYLVDAAASAAVLYANLTFWIVGSTLIGLGGYLLSFHGTRVASRAARMIYGLGPALAVTSFVAWMALIRLATGSGTSLELADTLGFFASRLDWVATIILVAVGPVLLAISSRGTWMSNWLYRFGLIAGVAGVITAISMVTGGLTTYGILSVPLGIGWTVVAGIVAARQS